MGIFPSYFSVDSTVLNPAFELLCFDHFTKKRKSQGLVYDDSHVFSSWSAFRVWKAMRIAEEAGLHSNGVASGVHKSHENLEVWLSLLFLEYFSCPLGHGKSGIIATGEHEPVTNLSESEFVSFQELGWSSCSFLNLLVNNQHFLIHVKLIFFNDKQATIKGDDFGQWGNFPNLSHVGSCDDLSRRKFHHDEILCCDVQLA